MNVCGKRTKKGLKYFHDESVLFIQMNVPQTFSLALFLQLFFVRNAYTDVSGQEYKRLKNPHSHNQNQTCTLLAVVRLSHIESKDAIHY